MAILIFDNIGCIDGTGKTTARALKRRRARIRKLKEAVCAAAAKEAESVQETSEESAAEQRMPAVSAQLQLTHPAEALELAAANGPAAASSAELHAASDESAHAMAVAQGTARLQPTRTNGQQQHMQELKASAVPARSVRVSLHDNVSASKEASPDGLPQPSLSSILQEAAQSGARLSASRRGQLANALQDAALAASQLHLALQFASAILRSEPEAAAPVSQDAPVEGIGGTMCTYPRQGRQARQQQCAHAHSRCSGAGSRPTEVSRQGGCTCPTAQCFQEAQPSGEGEQRCGRLRRIHSSREEAEALRGRCRHSERCKTGKGKEERRGQADHQPPSGKGVPEGVVGDPMQDDMIVGQPVGPEAALPALTSLSEGVQAWRADKAARSAGMSEGRSSEEAVPDQAVAAASEVAVEAQPVAEADEAEIPGLAAESSKSAAHNVSALLDFCFGLLHSLDTSSSCATPVNLSVPTG